MTEQSPSSRFNAARVSRAIAEVNRDKAEWKKSHREMWGAINDALKNQRLSGEPVGEEMLHELEEQLDWLAKGKIPPSFKELGSKGNASTPLQDDAKIGAIIYMRAADLEVVKDRRSRTTVKEHFGLNDTRRIRRWLRDPKYLNVGPSDVTYSPVDSHKMTAEEMRLAKSEIITSLMKSAGKFWRKEFHRPTKP
jgi:hypothetical protein